MQQCCYWCGSRCDKKYYRTGNLRGEPRKENKINMKIPFVDLHTQYLNLKQEIDGAITSVIRDSAFVGGTNNKYVRRFEEEFSAYLGVKHTISCANGTDSLEILFEAFGIKPGD